MSLRVGDGVPKALADAEVLDHDGGASPLHVRWSDGPAALVFLRHFGCAACTEHVAILASRLHELVRLGLSVVYVGNGAPNFIDGFVERNDIDLREVEIVTDPSLDSYKAAGFVRNPLSAYGPAALYRVLRAMLMGHRQGATEGDQTQQGGVVLVDRDGKIAYYHPDRGTGDHAPTSDVVDAAMRVAVCGGDEVRV